MATTAAPRDYRQPPTRSNSLQKMLELEKQAMFQRQHQPAAQDPIFSIPYNQMAPSQRPVNSRARTYSNSNVSYQRQPPPRQPTLPSPSHTKNNPRILSLPQLPPLTVNFPDFNSQHQHGLGINSPPLSTPSQDSITTTTTTSSTTTNRRTTLPALTKSLSSTETLTHQLASAPSDADERQSVCTSPSWEAYARAKQVKKDQKEQREKEKEQALREQKAKKRARLSKQPPPLSTSAGFAAAAAGQTTAMRFSTRNKSDVTMGARGPVKARPASVVGLVAPPLETTAANKRESRSRSGSFSSLLRAFDPRKHSDEEPSSSAGFVGGIKLEQQKFENGEQTSEKAIETHRMLSDPDIHPALRDTPVFDSSSPMASDASLPHVRPRSHVANMNSGQPATAEEGKSHKWRSYIGLKKHTQHHQKHESKDSILSAESKRKSKILISGPILSSEAEAKVAETLAKAETKDASLSPLPTRPVWQSGPEVSQPDVLPAFELEATPDAFISVSPPSPDVLRPRNSGRLTASRSQRARRQQRRLQQADELDIPPPPPRRSSKRKSWVALDHRAPPVPKLALSAFPAEEFTTLTPPERPPPERPSSIQISPPPSPRSHEQRHASSSPSFDRDRLSPHSRQHSTSSEDSASDYSHSASSPSTPASSRPQSDTELSPVIADIERFFLDDGPYRSEAAGAELKDIPIRQPSIHRRSRDGRLVLDPGFVPQLEVPVETKARSFPLVARKLPAASAGLGDVLPLAPAKQHGELGGDSKPIAKVFVECCGCRYYHDLPSKLYEAISAAEEEMVHGQGMTVQCPWCKHGMSRKCCAGLAAMVYVKERLH